jgi:hypothetical protein
MVATPLRHWLPALAIGVVLMLAAAPRAGHGQAGTPAGSSDLFAVSGLPVDASAESAAAARRQALAEGERRAIGELLRRLTPRDQHQRLPRPDSAALEELVQGIEIADEKTSATRYVAKLTVRFRSDGVRRLLREAGIPYTETRSKPLLVVPVYDTGAGRVLWDDPNPWREAWGRRSDSGGLVPIVLPLGDLADYAAVDAERAAGGDEPALRLLAQRYGAGDVLVVHAVLRASPPPRLDVQMSRFGSGGAQAVVESFTGQGDDPGQLLQEAVSQIVAGLQESWKRETALRFDRESQLSARVPLSGLQEWIAVRERLGRTAEVRDIEIAALSRHDAQVVVRYYGEPAQLALALAQRDLTLREEAGGWLLELTGAAAAAVRPVPAAPAAEADTTAEPRGAQAPAESEARSGSTQ